MGIDLNDLRVFAAVVSEEGFTAAGRKLGLPASAVSRRIARLEDDLGFQLLHRTTRRVGLTDSGRLYFERTAHVMREIDDASRAVIAYRSIPSGLLRVTAPPDDGGVIWAMLSGFVRDHSQVDLELVHTLEYVDLVERGIDVALRGGRPPDSTLYCAHKLIESRLILVASPEYLERRGVPQTPGDLAEHDCVAMDTWVPNAIPALMGPEGPVPVDFHNRIRVNRQDTARNAVLDGFGIAPTVAMNCWRELESGALVEVLPGSLPGPALLWAVHPAGRTISAAARALVEHLKRVAPKFDSPA